MARYDDRPHCLYRLWSKDGGLLYVGCTASPLNRLKEHEFHKLWASSIASATMEWFPNRAQAMEAEWRAIQAESPEWNVHGNAKKKTKLRGRFNPAVDRFDPSTWATVQVQGAAQ
jgi:predicted GIY-YIG superfamily endonuclease